MKNPKQKTKAKPQEPVEPVIPDLAPVYEKLRKDLVAALWREWAALAGRGE